MSRTQRRNGRKAYRRLRLRMRKGDNRHHRRCRSNGGGLINNDGTSNISIVRRDDHDHWHALFSNHTPMTIAAIINEKWIPQDYEFICVERKHV